MHARADALNAAVQEENKRRSKVLTGMIAVGSMIALPPGLLVAFFGVPSTDVDPTASIVDIERSWLAYALAWLPFAALVLAGFWLRQRVGRGSSSLVGSSDDRLLVTATNRPPPAHIGNPSEPASSTPAEQVAPA